MLFCPSCKTAGLTEAEIEPRLTALRCGACGGLWLRGAHYWKWLEAHGPNLPELKGGGDGHAPPGDGEYRDCPECRFRMTKFRVGHGLGFAFDHCEGCKGLWLDRDEWGALRERNLHDDLHSMLTACWQAEALKEERRARLERIYEGRFGEEDFAELRRFRAWLYSRPNRSELLAFLTDADPFGL